MTACDSILQAIRSAVPANGLRAVPTEYRHASDMTSHERLERFTGRLRDYGVTVLQATAAEIASTVEQRFRHQNVTSLLVPPDLPPEWRPQPVRIVEDAGQSASELARIEGVMTGCAVAVAETGTIVLDAGPRQGRRAVTLVPDYYLCVVLSEQIVGLVPEAISRLREAAQAGRPITFISGPSATADIELRRVAGVHGPRRLDVLIVSA